MAVDYNTIVNALGTATAEEIGIDELNLILAEAIESINDYILNSGVRVKLVDGVIDTTDFSTFELLAIDNAVIEQVKYVVANGGDLGNLSGFNRVERKFDISQEDIMKNKISARAKDKLARTRFAFRGVR